MSFVFRLLAHRGGVLLLIRTADRQRSHAQLDPRLVVRGHFCVVCSTLALALNHTPPRRSFESLGILGEFGDRSVQRMHGDSDCQDDQKRANHGRDSPFECSNP